MKENDVDHTLLVFFALIVLIFIIGNRVLDFTDFKEVCESAGGNITRTNIGFDCEYPKVEGN